jgi:parvulin-like peptidyl-prolyl isomerase
MKRLLREPLLHFFTIGVLLFALYGWLQGSLFEKPTEIVVSRGQLQSLQAQFERVWQRPPTSQELQGLIENWVREEIFYREGLAMGLERDDQVVRRRVGQKLEFIIDGATPPTPTAEELQNWLDSHADKYVVEPKYTLRQIYFDPARHGERLQADVAAAQRALAAGKVAKSDSTMLPSSLDGAREFEIARAFGDDFAKALATLPVGGWQGPIQSGFGVHLVEVVARDSGRKANLEDVRAEVERDLLHSKTQAAKESYYQRLRSNYAVRIESSIEPKG